MPDRVSNTVSVILPYYNRADSLHAAATSVLNQTHEDLILYLINDGSTDGSREVARELRDARVEHVDLPSNCGACVARNTGLASATTELVAFMDSDDVWLPHKMEQQVANLRERQRDDRRLSVLGSGWRYRGKDEPAKQFQPGPFGWEALLRGVAGTTTSTLLVDRSRAAGGAAFDPSLPAFQDRDFVLSCVSNGSRLGVLPEVLVVLTRGRDDHVANPANAAAAWERYFDKYGAALAADEELRSWYHFRAGRQHLLAGRPRAALPHVRESLGFNSRRRAVHLGLGVVAGRRGLAVAQKQWPL